MSNFTSSVIIWDNGRSVGLTIKSTQEGDKSFARIIGFSLKPNANEYRKIFELHGVEDGVIIPEINLLVKVEDLFKGDFRGVEVPRKPIISNLQKGTCDGKRISLQTLERVPFSRFQPREDQYSQINSAMTGVKWEPVAKPKTRISS